MQLHKGQLPSVSRAIVKSLVDGGDIEVGSQREAARDVESVLSNYVSQLDQVLSRARTMVQQRGLPQGEFGRVKRLCAEQAGIKLDDDALDYVLEQLIQMLMHSESIEDVFSEDHVLKRRMRGHLGSGDSTDARIEQEVRNKLKHVKEGTRVWEIEYARMKADIKRRRGL